VTKTCLFLINKMPESELILTETLDALLTFSAFDLKVSVLLLDDGVYLLRASAGHATDEHGLSRFMATLDFYGIEPVWAERESLESRGFAPPDATRRPRLLDRRELPAWLRQYAMVLGL
jgi:sulfur relay protein TusC/DsrF